MGIISTSIGIFGFIIGLPAGLIVGFFMFVYSKPKVVKEPLSTLEEFDASSIHRLFPLIPEWVKSPDYERVDWLNKFLLDMWPYLDKGICDMIKTTVRPMFGDYIGKYQIEEIDFETVTLGTLCPTFHGMKVYDTNENQLVMETSIKWAGNPNIVVSVKIMNLRIRIQLLDLQVYASPRIHLKPLVPTLPCFGSITVSLMEKPHVDFGLSVQGGDIMSIPGLYHYVQDAIKSQVASICHWPYSLEIPILDSSLSTIKKPVGILHVNVVRATNLLKMDCSGTSDPYVKLYLSGEKLHTHRTSTKKKNLNPVWNEKFKLTVKDPENQALELHVYDWDKVGHDDILGVQIVPLKELTSNEPKEFMLDLLNSTDQKDHQNIKARGQLVIEMTFEPFKIGSKSLKSFRSIISRQGSTIQIESLDDKPMSGAGVLVVTIIEAEHIQGEHHTNSYAQITLGGEKKKTQVIKKNSSPRWDEEFEFLIEEPPLKEKLHIQILSKGRALGFLRKVSLGYVDIGLTDVVRNGRINEKYNLIDSKNGTIHVEIEWQAT